MSREGSSTGLRNITDSGFCKTGLENIGNTCYFNVILQSLFHIPQFNEIFIDGSYKRKLNRNQSSTICDEYASLLKKTKESSVGQTKSKFSWKKSIQDYVSTKDFKRELVNNYVNFKGYEQHDAHEFCTSLLDLMSKELDRVKTKPKYKELKISSKASISDQAEKWAKYFREREDSHVTDFFQGQMLIEMECKKCKNMVYSFDTCMFIHLDISGTSKVTLDELIEGMSAPETIEEYKCSKCK